MLAASSASVPEPPPSRASGEVELVQLPAADGGLPVAVDTSAVFPEQAAPAAVTPWQPAVGMQALEVHSRSSQFHHPAAVKEITTIKPRNKLGENKNQTQKKNTLSIKYSFLVDTCWGAAFQPSVQQQTSKLQTSALQSNALSRQQCFAEMNYTKSPYLSSLFNNALCPYKIF